MLFIVKLYQWSLSNSFIHSWFLTYIQKSEVDNDMKYLAKMKNFKEEFYVS